MNDMKQHLYLLDEDDKAAPSVAADDYYYWQNFQASLDNMRSMDEGQDDD